jgi:hypothetical protein
MEQQLTILCSPRLVLINELCETKFEKAVTEAVDESLSALGNCSKQTIYRHLENRYGIRKEEIPRKIAGFTHAVEETFGSVAKLIEIKIIKNLHSKNRDFHYATNKDELNFIEFINRLQNYLDSQV